MSDKNENLKEILSRFLDAGDAAGAAEDIAQGDRLFQQHPAPKPDAQLLEQINVQIAAKLASRPTTGVRWMRRSAVAAVAVVFVSLAAVLMSPSRPPLEVPGGWWDEHEPTVKSASTGKSLSAEMDDLLEQIITISREEYYFEDEGSVFDETEIEEIEMIATSDDFWKG